MKFSLKRFADMARGARKVAVFRNGQWSSMSINQIDRKMFNNVPEGDGHIITVDPFGPSGMAHSFERTEALLLSRSWTDK